MKGLFYDDWEGGHFTKQWKKVNCSVDISGVCLLLPPLPEWARDCVPSPSGVLLLHTPSHVIRHCASLPEHPASCTTWPQGLRLCVERTSGWTESGAASLSSAVVWGRQPHPAIYHGAGWTAATRTHCDPAYWGNTWGTFKGTRQSQTYWSVCRTVLQYPQNKSDIG